MNDPATELWMLMGTLEGRLQRGDFSYDPPIIKLARDVVKTLPCKRYHFDRCKKPAVKFDVAYIGPLSEQLQAMRQECIRLCIILKRSAYHAKVCPTPTFSAQPYVEFYQLYYKMRRYDRDVELKDLKQYRIKPDDAPGHFYLTNDHLEFIPTPKTKPKIKQGRWLFQRGTKAHINAKKRRSKVYYKVLNLRKLGFPDDLIAQKVGWTEEQVREVRA